RSAASTTNASGRRWSTSFISTSDVRADAVELGEERQIQSTLEEVDAGAAAGALLEPDRALHGAQVAEAPELEGVLEVDEVLAGGVLGPVRRGVAVDPREHQVQLGHLHPGPAHVTLEDARRHRMSVPGEVA